jgi:hypothetical protein
MLHGLRRESMNSIDSVTLFGTYTGTFGYNLQLIFLVLKLTNLISWSWWWVLAPMWIFFLVYSMLYLSMHVIIATNIIKK